MEDPDPVTVTYIVLALLSVVVILSAFFSIRRKRLNAKSADLSGDEFQQLASSTHEIPKDAEELIRGVVDFSDTIVREVMVPRKDVVAIDVGAGFRDVVKVFMAERLSRLLVIGDDLDDVRGVLLLKDLLPVIARGGSGFKLKEYMRPAYFVPNTKKIDRLLQEMKHGGAHLAVVLDEHGGVDGIVTIEDLLEEIVGEIRDEFDRPTDGIEVYETKAGDLLVNGTMSLYELNEKYSFHFPLGEYDTVSGYVLSLFGRIPEAGESVDVGSIRIKVEQVKEHRIELVRILQRKKRTSTNGLVLSAVQSTPERPEIAHVSGQAKVRISNSH